MFARQHPDEAPKDSPLQQCTDPKVQASRGTYRSHEYVPQIHDPQPSSSNIRPGTPRPPLPQLERKPDPHGLSFRRRMEADGIADGMQRRPTNERSRQGLGEAQAGLRRQQNTVGRGSGRPTPRKYHTERPSDPLGRDPKPGLLLQDLASNGYKPYRGENETSHNNIEAVTQSSKHFQVNESLEAPNTQPRPSTRPQGSSARTNQQHENHRAGRLSSNPPPQPQERTSSLPQRKQTTPNPNPNPNPPKSQTRPKNDRASTQSHRQAPSSAEKAKQPEATGRNPIRGLWITNPDSESARTFPQKPYDQTTTAEIERGSAPTPQATTADPSRRQDRPAVMSAHKKFHDISQNNSSATKRHSQNFPRDQRTHPVAAASQPPAPPLLQQTPPRDAVNVPAPNPGSNPIARPVGGPARHPRNEPQIPRRPIPDSSKPNPSPKPHASHEPPRTAPNRAPHDCCRELPCKYSNLRACSHQYIPVFIGILFVVATIYIFIYTLKLHRALPPKAVEGIWGAFGVLFLAVVWCNWWLCRRMKQGDLRCDRFRYDEEKYQEEWDPGESSFKRWRRRIEERHYECMKKRHEKHMHERTPPMNHKSKILRGAPNEDRQSEMTPSRLPKGGGGGFAPEIVPRIAPKSFDVENRPSHGSPPLPITHPSYLSNALSSFNASLYDEEIIPEALQQRFAEFRAQDQDTSSSTYDPYDFAWHDINRAAHMSRDEVATCYAGPGFGLEMPPAAEGDVATCYAGPSFGLQVPQIEKLRPQSPFENPLPCPIPNGPLKCTLSDRIHVWEEEESVVGEEGLGNERLEDVDEGGRDETGAPKREIEEEEEGRRDSPTRGYDEETVNGGQLWPRFGAYLEDELPERRGRGLGALKVSLVDFQEGSGDQ